MRAVQLQNVTVAYPQYNQPTDLIWEWLTRKVLHTTHYALNDLSFSLEQGSTLGIVGDNGAGKSTLLRVLAGTLKPSSGQCSITGKRAALLELGVGFQPHLSGSDNIRLGLALRGLNSTQTDEYLPQVIDFAELKSFINQPIKTYSSGMIMRLGFALATVIAPDVLIVDEALSVGDQHFQKKSLQRLKALVDTGATLIFCSHNLYQVRELCEQALWLEQGKIKQRGMAQRVVDAYQTACRAKEASTLNSSEIYAQSTSITTTSTRPFIQSAQLTPSTQVVFKTGTVFGVEVQVQLNGCPIQEVHLGVVIRRNDDIQCYGMSTLHEGVALQGKEQVLIRYVMDELPLLGGSYCLELWLMDQTGLHVYDSRERCCHFMVEQLSQSQGIGVCQLPHRWEIEAL